MSYRTPESLIRQIMSESHAPALKIPEPERVKDALAVLASNGIKSAAKQDENTITVSAAEVNIAANILDAAVQKGLIQAKPQMVSAEAVPVPDHRPEPITVGAEPHPPHGGNTFGEETEDETEQNKGTVKADGTVELEPRSLNNRMQNQIKKIDEEEDIDTGHPGLTDDSIVSAINSATRAVEPREILEYVNLPNSAVFAARVANLAEAGHFMTVDGKFTKNNPVVGTISEETVEEPVAEEVEQIDELSTDTLKKVANVARQKNRPDVLRAAIKAGKRNRDKPDYKFAGEEVEQIDELSYAKLKAYTAKGAEALSAESGADKLSKKIAQRKAYLHKAAAKKVKIISKAAFGEEAKTPVDTVLRVLSEAGSLRLKATIHSDCGKHHAKIYKDHEWNEHRVKFFPNGKHHEPADYHTDDYEDAHGTAKHQLAHLSKLNGALKEAAEDGDLPFLSEASIKEVSKKLGHHGYKKFGESDYVAHDEVLTTFHHPDHGHLVSVNHHSLGRVKSASVMKCKDSKTGEMHKWGEDHPHVEAALRELGHKSYVGFKEEVELVEFESGVKKIGTYHDKAGSTITMHRSANDPKHHFLVHDGKVRDYHHGSAQDFHKKITTGEHALTGTLHENYINDLRTVIHNHGGRDLGYQADARRAENRLKKKGSYDKDGKTIAKEELEQIDELSPGTLTNYAIRAAKSKTENLAKSTSLMAKANGVKGEPEVRTALHAKAAKSHRKVNNRHDGIKKAMGKLTKDCHTAGVCESNDGEHCVDSKCDGHEGNGAVRAAKVTDEHNRSWSQCLKCKAAGRKSWFTWDHPRDPNKRATSNEPMLDKPLRESAEQIDEISNKTMWVYAMHAKGETERERGAAGLSGPKGSDYTGASLSDEQKKRHNRRFKGLNYVAHKLTGVSKEGQKSFGKDGTKLYREEVELTEGKKDDLEKAKKHMFKLPIANELGKSIHTAARHFNYVQDACDHVYSNHVKDLPYEDYDKIKPHLEDTFKAHGLK